MLQTFAILQEKESKGDSEIIRATIPPESKAVSTFVSKDRTANPAEASQQVHMGRVPLGHRWSAPLSHGVDATTPAG